MTVSGPGIGIPSLPDVHSIPELAGLKISCRRRILIEQRACPTEGHRAQEKGNNPRAGEWGEMTIHRILGGPKPTASSTKPIGSLNGLRVQHIQNGTRHRQPYWCPCFAQPEKILRVENNLGCLSRAALPSHVSVFCFLTLCEGRYLRGGHRHGSPRWPGRLLLFILFGLVRRHRRIDHRSGRSTEMELLIGQT
jgi:hypothetical protein